MSIIPEYYTSPDNVNEYIAMTSSMDASEHIDVFKKYLPRHSTLLEIGSGPGNDYSLLSNRYKVTGSDMSIEFLKHLKKSFPQGEFLELDAASLETALHFDAIYSNKVLQHLTDEELEESINNQIRLLNPEGLICHSFWKGNGTEDFNGMFVNNQTEDTLTTFFTKHFDILHLSSYKEFEEGDSLLLIARKH